MDVSTATQGTTPLTTPPVSIAGNPTSSASSGQPVQINGSPIDKSAVTTRADAGSSDSSASAGASSVAVQTMLRLIAQLKKQLAQEEQALHKAMAQTKSDDPSGLARITGLQSAVTTTIGQLAIATNKLAAALVAEGQSSTGSQLNTSA